MRTPRVTMRQVADEAGVAVMTVSYTFTRPQRVAAATRARVLAVADRLGYAGPDPVARSLRSGSIGNLGVVLGEHLTYAFEDPQAARFLAGVSHVCVEGGLGLTLIPSTGGPSDAVRVQAAAVDGFVLWTTSSDDPVLAAVAATGRPAAIQGGPAATGIALVTADDRGAARAVALSMLEGAQSPLILSHPLSRERWSGVVHGPETEVPFPVTRARLAGFREAVEESGRTWSQIPVAVVARHTRALGQAVVAGLLADLRPDVIIAMSDELAAGALDAMHGAGTAQTGRPVRVSGWDDSGVAEALGFTSVRQSLYDQGVRCARIASGLSHDSESEPTWELRVR